MGKGDPLGAGDETGVIREVEGVEERWRRWERRESRAREG